MCMELASTALTVCVCETPLFVYEIYCEDSKFLAGLDDERMFNSAAKKLRGWRRNKCDSVCDNGSGRLVS